MKGGQNGPLRARMFRSGFVNLFSHLRDSAFQRPGRSQGLTHEAPIRRVKDGAILDIDRIEVG